MLIVTWPRLKRRLHVRRAVDERTRRTMMRVWNTRASVHIPLVHALSLADHHALQWPPGSDPADAPRDRHSGRVRGLWQQIRDRRDQRRRQLCGAPDLQGHRLQVSGTICILHQWDTDLARAHAEERKGWKRATEDGGRKIE